MMMAVRPTTSMRPRALKRLRSRGFGIVDITAAGFDLVNACLPAAQKPSTRPKKFRMPKAPASMHEVEKRARFVAQTSNPASTDGAQTYFRTKYVSTLHCPTMSSMPNMIAPLIVYPATACSRVRTSSAGSSVSS